MVDTVVVAKKNLKHAIESGVKIALGTDAAVYPHGLNAHELDVYVNQMGMTPLAALQSATLNAADLMGWSAKTGSIEPGHWADIIAVKENPLQDVRVLQHVNFVMKSGVVYKNETATQEPHAIDASKTISDLQELRTLTADDHGAQRIAWTPTWLKARDWFQTS